MAKALTDNDRKRLNDQLKVLEATLEEINKGKQAGFAWGDELGERCTNCIDNIKKIKATYFKGKP